MKLIGTIQFSIESFLSPSDIAYSSYDPQLRILSRVCLILIALLISGCGAEQQQKSEIENQLFELLPSTLTGVHFSNDLTPDNEHNIFTDSNFYAGGGVAIGDFNNDGLPDIYLVSNQGPNRLYLNRGNFRFEDITEIAGVAGSKPWSTGVSLVDITGNGYLDIYLLNSAGRSGKDRKNELFLNNGDLTFTESAENFGIADSGYSIHASFFDYDGDGLLDLYIVNNHAHQPIGAYDLSAIDRSAPYFESGDRLYRNEGERFRDVTQEAGIYSGEAALGLGVSVGDLNRNGWPDIYVSNDFFERDYLYLNNGDGTFTEALTETLSSISTTSMGGDIADLNNDGYPEILVSDMLPSSNERLKKITDFISWEQYIEEVELGYHRKFTRNTLQLNLGDGTFSEIGRYSGVAASDWSWGGWMADYNHSGLRDILVTNGFYKDVTDKDHLMQVSRPDFMRQIMVNGEPDLMRLLELMPTTPIVNHIFENHGKMRFTERSADWGLDQAAFSHGAAWADLNGNGALDLVINNVNGPPFIYRNRVTELYPERAWLQIELDGEFPNRFAVGTQIEITAGDQYWFLEQYPQRGYQSSMDPVLHVGLGEGVERIDTLLVRWPDGSMNTLTELEVRQRVRIVQKNTEYGGMTLLERRRREQTNRIPLLAEIEGADTPQWRHRESQFSDFDLYPMLFRMRSAEGPPICSGDLNGNGQTEIYVGGAAGQPGALFTSDIGGTKRITSQATLEDDASYEDTDCFVLPDGMSGRDGQRGVALLYVASGSSEFAAGSDLLRDRLYRMNEDGELIRIEDALPRPAGGHRPTGVVRGADLTGDGRLELFVGSRLSPFGTTGDSGYGVEVGGMILADTGNGTFVDRTAELAPGLLAAELGSAGITAAEWGDLSGNGMPDLVVAGEWMPVTIFYNHGGVLKRESVSADSGERPAGWWQSLALTDLNGNGKMDIVAGNYGLNSRFRASAEEPVELWIDDWNRNGRMEHLFGQYSRGKGPFPVSQYNDLLDQLSHIRLVVSGFSDYAGRRIDDLFSPDLLASARHYRAEELASSFFINRGDGRFEMERMPWQAQLFPVYAILPADLDGDGIPEILLGGNLDRIRPQEGAQDAGNGLVLKRTAAGRFEALDHTQSGFRVSGEIRTIHLTENEGIREVLIGRNNDELKRFVIR